MDYGLRATNSEWVLVLNKDATIERDALRRALERPIPDDVGTTALQMRFAERPEIVN